MTLKEIITIVTKKLPLDWKLEGYNSYNECIENEGRKYFELLEELDEDINLEAKISLVLKKKTIINASKSFQKTILKSLDNYVNEGNTFRAFETLQKGFETIPTDKSHNELYNYFKFYKFQKKHYRLRKSSSKVEMKDIFHVPFQNRHNIASNRYSTPGFPTLYLSSSIYLAYNELDKPEFNNLYASTFSQSNNSHESLLDLRNNPDFESDQDKALYLIRWPLLLACSIKTAYSKSPFKVEYIIPQMIFQWIRIRFSFGDKQKKVFGVCYTPTKCSNHSNNRMIDNYNIAIPIKTPQKSGYCKDLTQFFLISKPITLQEGLIVDYDNPNKNYEIEIHGVKYKYNKTSFGKIENYIDTLPLQALNF